MKGQQALVSGQVTRTAYTLPMCRTAIVSVMLLLTGCASSSFAPNAGTRLAPWEGEVTVLARLPAEGSYRLLGVVTVKGVALTSDERMFDQLRERAAYQGADAVVLQREIRDRPTSGSSDERSLAAYAIRRR